MNSYALCVCHLPKDKKNNIEHMHTQTQAKQTLNVCKTDCISVELEKQPPNFFQGLV